MTVTIATAATAPRTRIESVQFMRGIAALLVVAHHTSLIMAHPEYGGLAAFGAITSMGWSGVTFFFVLSGFIIMYAHERDIGMPQRLGSYAWRRFSRVYPVYWVFLTGFMVAALAGFGKRDFSTDPANLLTAYSLIQIVLAPSLPLKVAWTLIYEIGFYIAFATLILNRRLGIAVFAAWLVLILVDTFVVGRIDMGLGAIWSLHFFFGIAAFHLTRRLPAAAGWPLLAAGIAALLAMGATGTIPGVAGDALLRPWTNVAIGLPYTAILIGVVLLERHARRAMPARLALIGNASFALYLVHSAIISFACILNHRFTLGLLSPRVMFFVIAGLAVTGGIAAHLLVERPLLRLVRAGARRARPSTDTVPLRDHPAR